MRIRPKIVAWLGALILLAFNAPAVAQEAQQKANELLQTAQKQYQSGDWEAARKNFEQAYEAAPENSQIKAAAALEWSSLLWEQGDYRAAEKRVADALARAKKLGLDEAIGQLLLTQGHIEASRGKLRSAENTLKICMKMAGEQGDEVFAGLCKLNHRLVRQLRGRPVGPDADYRKAIAKLEAAGTPLAVGSSLAKTAELYAENGDPARAMQLLQKAQAQFAKAKSVPAQARNKLKIARLLQRQGRFAEARKYSSGLVAKFQAMNNRPALVEALVLSAQDAQSLGKTAKASKRYERALSVAKQTGSPNLVARGHLALCEFGVGIGQAASAIKHCAEAGQRFDKLGIPDLEARSKGQLAGLYHGQGKLNDASTAYSAAIQILEKTRTPSTNETAALTNYRANLCQVEMSLQSNGAHHLCRKALEELKKQSTPDPQMLASTYYAVGVTAGRDIYARRGLKSLAKAAEIAESLSTPDYDLASDAQLRRGVILARDEDKQDEAAAAFRKGIALTEKAGDKLRAGRVQLHIQLAQLEMSRDNWKQARKSLEAVVAQAKGDAQSQAWAYSGLARARVKLGDEKGAKKALEKGLPLAKQAGDEELVETFEENLAQFE